MSLPYNKTVLLAKKLFWHHNIMQKFRDGRGHTFMVSYHSTTLEEEIAWLFSDHDHPESALMIFEFKTLRLCDEPWAFVSTVDQNENPILVVPPFSLMCSRKNIPHFPEEG